MSYPSWIAPDEKDVSANVAQEPEGERLRRELTEWLEHNRICGILMDTPHHHVSINFGPNLPNKIKNVLGVWGSIYVVVSNEVDWQNPIAIPAFTKPVLRKFFV